MANDLTTHGGSSLVEAEEIRPAHGSSMSEVSALVQLAITEKVPAEQLERLIDLKIKMEDRAARAAFVAALTAFRAECPPIVKTRENEQFTVQRNGAPKVRKYAPLDEIDRVARPVAARHGLTWTWDTAVDDRTMRISCRVLHIDGHYEVTTVTMPLESRAGSSLQQKYGSAQTYGMRYSLVAALGITTVDDDMDGNDTGGDEEVITEDQARELEALLETHGRDKAAFCKWLDVESLRAVPAKRFQYVCDVITARGVKQPKAAE